MPQGYITDDEIAELKRKAERADELERLVVALWEGPAAADVSEVDVRHEPARGNLVGFAIRSGAHRGD